METINIYIKNGNYENVLKYIAREVGKICSLVRRIKSKICESVRVNGEQIIVLNKEEVTEIRTAIFKALEGGQL